MNPGLIILIVFLSYAALGALTMGALKSVSEDRESFLPAMFAWPAFWILGVGYLIFRLGNLIGNILKGLK